MLPVKAEDWGVQHKLMRQQFLLSCEHFIFCPKEYQGVKTPNDSFVNKCEGNIVKDWLQEWLGF